MTGWRLVQGRCETPCPNHDSAFDTGLITVNGGLRIHRATVLDERVVADGRVQHYFGPGILGERLLVTAAGVAPRAAYLRYHHEHVVKGSVALARQG